ncbi:PREDICTED: protein cfxQ homolog isoform X2 [Erythranthe guttata]|uniref:protein cfxQ homolog isoform X2 n=1 Tax=Erythranthe guttata TaxID=4155 RepID=UPI00064DD252|nr:PREDICTED: protein cfxQ homolog isoform X2 [Erythranthe guttata]|eukprot:XP_012849532.1 PREDICTED: protein cfxQ homolog isoform X2 [Erythranthe guttata]
MRIKDKKSKLLSDGNTSIITKTIHECAETGDLVVLQSLLRRNPSLLNQTSDDIMSHTPLHCAANFNRVEIIAYLIGWGGPGKVELEARNVYGETPLHVAAKNGCNEALKLLLQSRAYVEASTNNSMTPLHLAVGYALRSGENSTVKTLLEYNADCSAKDDEGMIPFNYLPAALQNEELIRLLKINIPNQNRSSSTNDNSGIQGKMEEFDQELSKIVGLHELKLQLKKWAKGMLMDEKRRAMGIDLGPRKPPHMAFLGNPGTGKTTVARILGKLLQSVGVLSSDSVTEVQRSDLIAEYTGQTGPKTRKKIEEAMGGTLFVDEAYRLAPERGAGDSQDFGVEALEEIMSVLEDGDIVVIFAGYTEPMKRVFSSNAGFTRRVTHFFQFDDFTCKDLAEMVMIKMSKQNKKSRLYGFKLHPSCTSAAVLAVIEKNSTEKLRNKMNGGLVDHMLNNARENLDSRLNFDSKGDELLTITLSDLEAGLKTLSQRVNVD